MICEICGLEMIRISEIKMTLKGETNPNRTPMSYKCPNGHYQHREYDNLTK